MDLGIADLRILWLFSDHRARTLKEIAEELHLEQSTVNRQINAALSAGLVQRERRVGSHAYEFSRSAEGERAFESDVAKSLNAFRAGLDAVGDDAEAFLVGFTRFVDAYAEAVHSDSGAGEGGTPSGVESGPLTEEDHDRSVRP